MREDRKTSLEPPPVYLTGGGSEYRLFVALPLTRRLIVHSELHNSYKQLGV